MLGLKRTYLVRPVREKQNKTEEKRISLSPFQTQLPDPEQTHLILLSMHVLPFCLVLEKFSELLMEPSSNYVILVDRFEKTKDTIFETNSIYFMAMI
jgi:hypothetical protein